MKRLVLILMVAVTTFSCTPEEEPCTETVCPDGFSSCFEKPCEL